MTYARQITILAAVLFAAYMLLLGVSCSTQRKFLYFPSHLDVPTRMTSWRVRGELWGYGRTVAKPRRVWLMLHGNGGQAAHRDYILGCVSADDAVYVLEYPGYGYRAGTPTKASIDAAAIAAYQQLRGDYPGVFLGVIGESLGTGPACVLAQQPTPPDRLVLITPFDTLANVAAEHMWFLPARLILQDRWDNIAALHGYAGPIEIYAAERDTVIPARHAKVLAEATGAKFTLLPGGHNDWSATRKVKL
jgi:pimeloyl-ACP methyl ester carboxylesterase